MSDAQVIARLDDSGKAEPNLMPVGPSGRSIVLDVPPGVELLRASLTLQAPGDDETVDLVPGATLATSTSKNQLSASEPIEWFSLDWGTRRPLTSLVIQTAETPKGKGRLSVAEGGPWYPPTPSDTVALGGTGQSLPGIMASRLMVELVDATSTSGPTAPKVLAATKLSGVVVKAAARPSDLTVLVEPGVMFFHQATPLQPLQEMTLGDNLSTALQHVWPADLKGGRVTVTLRSSSAGKLKRLHLALDTATVVRTWSGGEASLRLPIASDGEVIARIDEVPGQGLREVRFLVRHQPRDEHLPLAPRPPPLPSLAHLCGSGYAAAQAFSPPSEGGSLVGIDLHLRPLTRAVKGTLSLFPDAHDRPAEKPLKGATLELAIEEKDDAPWPYRWIPFDLPEPLALDGTTWWAVLTVTEGDVLWSLGEPGSAPTSGVLVPRTALYRTGDTGPWLPRTGGPWAFSRPRLRAPATEPPPPPRVQLRWGNKLLDVTPDETGLVSLDAKALEALPPPVSPAGGAPPPLEVIVQSRIAGELTLSGLRVTSPRTTAHPLFQPPQK
ncbi:hypothetical protein JRI60_32320 [Archangium violaceum]|uniref:hypothetical protein n=1 Tax=Archangium violaceum TaxID=83451 RepID=UPI00194F8889|nr:hypothetical protein [Archangium violaceum]QRN93832.1 hypothetical protein JRI60_32320 [Archangium violaceum]